MSFDNWRLGNKQTRQQRTHEIMQSATGVAKEGADGIHRRYGVLDSPLDEGKAPMRVYFRLLLPHDTTMRAHVEHLLEDRKGEARGLELGGVGVRMFQGFSKGFFVQTAGVTLVDERPEQEQKEDQATHRVFEKNMFDPSLIDDLHAYFGEQRIDFIIERMVRGHEFVPHDPYMIGREIQKWYSLLAVGGVMFIQVPENFTHLLHKWGGTLRDQHIVFEYHDAPQIVFFLQKTAESPEELPLLTPREVHALYKDAGRL